MNTVRYWIALLLVVSLPGSLLLWFLIHPFVHFWHRVGLRLAITAQFVVWILVAYTMIRLHRDLLAMQFGTNYWLIALAVPLIVASGMMRKHLTRQLKFKTLAGLPEIAPEKYPQRLLTEGIYSRIRHPRYVQIVLALLAYALISNYFAAYVLFVITCVWVLAVVAIEERELRERFGAEWEEYAARVPRFFPTRNRSALPDATTAKRHHAG